MYKINGTTDNAVYSDRAFIVELEILHILSLEITVNLYFVMLVRRNIRYSSQISEENRYEECLAAQKRRSSTNDALKYEAPPARFELTTY